MSILITFEGLDGVGKSTQMRMLSSALQQNGYDVIVTREPGGTPLGEQLRDLLLHGGEVDARAEALLFAAARVHLIKTLILPSLSKGRVVLCDRYVDSSFAYQGFARGLGVEWVESINRVAVTEAMPRRTYLLSMDAEAAMKRHEQRAFDRMESQPPNFRAKVAEGFSHVAKTYPQRVMQLDAARSANDLAADILRDCLALLNETRG